ncbi:MAG: hypothetical protein VX910_13250 [Candidatus Latescibacterota bacterium]|nr:hypothetical protein [Candidatus Latescibacterota bacterium]
MNLSVHIAALDSRPIETDRSYRINVFTLDENNDNNRDPMRRE